MRTILRNAAVFTKEGFTVRDILVDDHRVLLSFSSEEESEAAVLNMDGLFIIPGFADVHVHLREPGFSYKETIRTGTMAAARGGYSVVCAMPNLKPAPSTGEALKQELDLIARDALVKVKPLASITMEQTGRGELGRLEETAPLVCAFSDDGKGIQDEETMREAMQRIRALDGLISAHCEDEAELKPGGCIHEGAYAAAHGHVGINSASEWKQVERDIRLCEETGVRYHVCHVSTKESVALIREAKARGVNVTCETGPHYLMFTDMDLQEDGKWKMNPPIRSQEDRHALLEGIKDGTIDCIITDHAPHSAEEKGKGLDKSSFGIVGLECCFAAMYHNLVLRDPEHPESGKGAITLEKLLELMCINPRRIFRLEGSSYIEDGCPADLAVLDLEKKWCVDADSFYSLGHSTLFDGMEVQGEVVSTFVDGRQIYDREKGILV